MTWQAEQLKASSVYKYYATIDADTDLVAEGGHACREIVVGTAGAIVVKRPDGTNITIPSEVVSARPSLPINAIAIVDSGTTAAKILVLW